MGILKISRIFVSLFPDLLISFLFGVSGALLIIRYGKKWGVLDKPNERSSHSRETPKGGGIGILAAFFFLIIRFDISIPYSMAVVAISLLSFIGDRIEVPPTKRLILQFLVAGILISDLKLVGFLRTSLNHFSPSTALIWMILIISLMVFIVGTANFYNFMDGINGIAAITGIVAFGLLTFISVQQKPQFEMVPLAFGMVLACLGFLPFNFPKSRIFMGDVGSILLGFAFSYLVLKLMNNWTDFFCFGGFLFPFYADGLITMMERIKDGESLILPHRRHLYQVLANEGRIEHWKVSVGYGFLQLLIGLILIFAKIYGIVAIFGILVFFLILFIVASYKIKKKLL
jgi:UDP-N-acetylmuramyl pentapeptide phosphotransferase/UDP-N-acetylglucosamine-1-phosphate transferase